VFASVGFRERLGDKIQFTKEESLESTGVISLAASGKYMRARIRIPSAVDWFLAQGIDPIISADGGR